MNSGTPKNPKPSAWKHEKFYRHETANQVRALRQARMADIAAEKEKENQMANLLPDVPSLRPTRAPLVRARYMNAELFDTTIGTETPFTVAKVVNEKTIYSEYQVIIVLDNEQYNLGMTVHNPNHITMVNAWGRDADAWVGKVAYLRTVWRDALNARVLEVNLDKMEVQKKEQTLEEILHQPQSKDTEPPTGPR